ncbi:MAG: NHLP leader peptide family RiPP precursor [Gammaproteobacteria bacterium]|nr:NHLP leader peptide family RiPP precursor [Gammaproteobacteria bacterium]
MRSGEEMLGRIVGKAALDPEFRQRLLSDPKNAIGDELGINIPESMHIVVHESDMQTVHLALPPDPNITGEQFEAVSAGLCCCW